MNRTSLIRLPVGAALAAVLLAGVAVPPVRAWWPKGHSIIAEGAVRALPTEVPRFFRQGTGQIAHNAQDPDVLKNRALPELRDAEDPEHFIDLELLRGKPLPPTRSEFLKLCAEEKLDPKRVGYVPYAVTEWTERLTMAFAEHRKWPRNPYIRQKCLVYAGMLAHYAGDMCQPLHLTLEFDGRIPAGGGTPKRGIHAKMDALIEKLAFTPQMLAHDQQPVAFDALLPTIVAEINAGRTHIDRVYALEADLPPEQGDWSPTPAARELGTERGRAATKFLASLYLTAWRKSASIELPPWLEREAK